MGLKWGERRRLRRLQAQSALLYEEATQVAEGEPPGRDASALVQDLVQTLAKASPFLNEAECRREAALCIIPVAQAGMWMEPWSWHRRVGFGLGVAIAVGSLRMDHHSPDIALERELGKHMGSTLDLTLYSVAQLGLLSYVGFISDFVLGDFFLGRQIVQTDEDRFLEAWDWATGLYLNGGLHPGQETRARQVMAGNGWLSQRQAAGIMPESIVGDLADWGSQRLSLLESLPDPLAGAEPGLSTEYLEAGWMQTLESVDQVALSPRAEWFLRAASLLCVTPLAAKISQRDVIYLVSSPFGGVAVRFFGGERYRDEPEVAQLPEADFYFLIGLREQIDKANSMPLAEHRNRASELSIVCTSVGHRIVAPILSAWPDLNRIALVPVGEMLNLPLSNSIVNGSRLADTVDLTIAPSAASIMVATTPRQMHDTESVVVMGDPAHGIYHLPWIATEVAEVAAVYGRKPDLLVEYHAESPRQNAAVREASFIPPTPIVHEHVLSQLENARVVHLACHGAISAETGSPELLLSGRIPFDALEHHRFAPGACVVLSACSLARNSGDAPFALLGFSAMLLAVGASAVLASSWPVLDCRETVDFMVQIHRNLSEGAAPGLALAAATAVMRKRGVPASIWAGFDVYGA